MLLLLFVLWCCFPCCGAVVRVVVLSSVLWSCCPCCGVVVRVVVLLSVLWRCFPCWGAVAIVAVVRVVVMLPMLCCRCPCYCDVFRVVVLLSVLSVLWCCCPCCDVIVRFEALCQPVPCVLRMCQLPADVAMINKRREIVTLDITLPVSAACWCSNDQCDEKILLCSATN